MVDIHACGDGSVMQGVRVAVSQDAHGGMESGIAASLESSPVPAAFSLDDLVPEALFFGESHAH